MSTIRVGWIGCGVMGCSMAKHLLKNNYSLTLYTRTKQKAEGLLASGATWVDSPCDVAKNSDVVFSIVGYPRDVEEVLLGQNGVLEGLDEGGILVDMTTSSPSLAETIAAKAAEKGCSALDCPVTGGDVGAKNASLSIFVGGETNALTKIKPLLACMGKKILYCGSAGMGQRAKLANQIAIAGVMFSTCESLLFASQAGLNPREWLEAVVAGAAGSTAMNTLGRRILDGDFKPGFFIDHFIKDLGLCLDECKRLGLVLPGTIAAEELYRFLQAQGHGKDGTQMLIAGLAKMCNKEWKAVP